MKRIIYILFIVGILPIYSCEDYLDVNVDPNNPVDAPTELVLPSVQLSITGAVSNYYHLTGSIWSQFYTQSNVASQYISIDNYDIQTTFLDREYQELYAGALNDIRFIKEKAVAEEDWTINLMATVLEAYAFQILADLYDRIVFKEAAQGGSGNFAPSFDPGAEVYDSLIIRIDNALSKDFGALTATDPGVNDLIFGGNINSWIAFANTLKLKILMRESLITGSTTPAAIGTLVDGGASFLTTDAAISSFVDETGRSNPLFESDRRELNTSNNLKGSFTLMNYLESNADPRLDTLFEEPLNEGVMRGQIQGTNSLSTTELDPDDISRAEILATDPAYFMTASEAYFLRAEAAARGFTSEDAESLYNAGVTAAFARFGEDMEAAAASFIGVGGAYEYPAGTQSENINAIMMQKWVSQARANGMEAWFDILRTGIPGWSPVAADDAAYDPTSLNGDGKPQVLTWPEDAVTFEAQGQYPHRLFYPDRETDRNPEAPSQTANTIFTAVWWDVID